MRLDKIYFMFHPVCWAHGMDGGEPPPGVDRDMYLHYLELESQVNERQRSLIRSMKPNEALVIFPVGAKQPMVDLEEYACSILGDRCIIVRRNAVAPPASWKDLPEPIERFLHDPHLPGKAGFLEGIPHDIQSELEEEIREASLRHGFGWSVDALKVVYFSRMAAMDIVQAFAQRDLHCDAARVQSEAFGEGFEQCAMTWRAMLVPYLGFATPPENNYDLSLSGATALKGAAFRERVNLENDVRLFLWMRPDGRPVGLYARAWCRLRDPQLYVRLSMGSTEVEMWDLSGQRRESNGQHPEAPVLNAIRRDRNDDPCYLVGAVPFDLFKQRLVDAEILER